MYINWQLFNYCYINKFQVYYLHTDLFYYQFFYFSKLVISANEDTVTRI